MNGSLGYSKEALKRLETGTYRGRQQKYRTSEEQVKAAPKKVPALEGMTRSPSFDQTGHVDTANARAKYEQRIGHNPIGRTSSRESASDKNYVVKRDRYNKLMRDSRLANDIKLLSNVYYNNANQDATVSEDYAYNMGAKSITGGFTKDEFLKTLSRRYGLTPKELNDMALTYHSDANKAEVANYGKQLKKAGEAHPVLGSVGSFVGTLGSGIEGVYNTAVGGLTGDDRFLSNMFSTTKKSPREGAKQNIKSDIAKGAYDVGMGIGDMAVGAAAGSAPVFLAGNTANEAQTSALERGSSVRKASAYGGAAGILDFVTNKIGLDKAKKLAVSEIKSTGIKKFLQQTAVAGTGEAMENVYQDIGQSLLDQIINGKNSELRLSYEDKIANGMSESDAFKAVAKEYAAQIGLSAATGFGMGSAMQAGTSVLPKVPEIAANKWANAKLGAISDDPTIRAIVAGAMEVPEPVSNAQKLQPDLGKVSTSPETPVNRASADTAGPEKLQTPMEKPTEMDLEEDLIGDVIPETNTRGYTPEEIAEINDYVDARNAIRAEMDKSVNIFDPNSMAKINDLREQGRAMDAEMADKYPELFENGKFTGIPEPGEITGTDVNTPIVDEPETLNNSEVSEDAGDFTQEPVDFNEQMRQLELARIRTELDLNSQMQDAIRTGRDSDGRMVTGVADAATELRRLSAERESLERQLNELSTPDERADADLDALTNFVNSQRRTDVNSNGGNNDVPPQNPPTSEEAPGGFIQDGRSRVVTNSGINANIISRFDYDNDPVLQEIAKYAKHNNETTYNNALENVKKNGASLIEEYNNGTRVIDNDQDVDQAMILLQNLSDQMRNGAEDVKPMRDLLFSRLREAGTKWGQNIQAFAKYNDTPEGAIINGERILHEPTEAWKTTNKKKVESNNRIAKALADMGNKWKQVAERPQPSHEKVKETVINELNKEFGSVEQLFDDADIEFLTILAENKDIPVWMITSEIEHKLNTGDWYTLDESIEMPKPTNQRLDSALKSLVEEQRVEAEPPTLDQIREEVRNSLDNEYAGVGEFTDEDVNYLANLINNGATREELADALNTKLATGRFAISEDTQNKVNQLFEYADHYDPESREAVEAKTTAYQLIANEVVGDATPLEKFETWRYLAMLGNPKTWIRNAVGNGLFNATTSVSNTLAAAIEAGTDKAVKALGGNGIQRTKTFLNPTKDANLIKAAGQDAEAHRYSQLSGTKYEKGTKDAIRRQKSVFNSKLIKLYEKVTDAGVSDYAPVKAKYSTSLAGYMKANGLNEKAFELDDKYMGLRDLSRRKVLTDAERSQMESLEDLHKAMEKARDYAVKQAEYATFHEDNAIAQFLTEQSVRARNSDKGAVRALGYLLEGTLPFKKTPANILRSGIEYSPLGAIKSIAETGKLIYENTGSRKGNLEDTYTQKSRFSGRDKTVDKTLASDVIDSWAKTLTGSGLLALGYYLKSKGILNSSDKDEKYQDDLEGIQNYSITINGKTYTVDWAAPAVMPMLVGAEISKMAERNAIPDQKWYGSIDDAINSVNALLDPIFETSMMQGVKNTLESAANEVRYNDDGAVGGILGSMATTMGTSYLTQALPTLSGQIARTVDPTRRTSDTASDSNFLSGVEKQGRKLMNKIPGLSYLNEEYRDAYGRTQNNSPFNNPLGNLAYQMMSPAYIRDINTTAADTSARKAYDASKDSKVFPTWKGKVTEDGVKLDPKQMSTYRKASGEANYQIRDALAKQPWFNELSGDRQSDILKKVNTLVDKIGKEAAGFEQDNSDLNTYKEGGIPALLDKYQDKQINKQIEETTGVSSSANVSKELKEAIKSGDQKAIQQKTQEAKQYAETKKTADEIGIEAKTYDKIANKAGSNAEKVYKAIPELKRSGLGSASAYYQYADALAVDPGLSTSEFVKTFNSIDEDNSKGIKQDELINFFNKNKTSQQQADKMWKMYGDPTWKKIPKLEGGSYKKVSK